MDQRIKDRILRYFARRDHSLSELRLKLRRFHTVEEITEALAWAQQQSWMPDETALSATVARRLHGKKRGIRAINVYLAKKGLPPQTSTAEQELEKATALLEKKYARLSWDRNLQMKAARFLTSRGFQADVIQKSLRVFKSNFDDLEI